MITYNLQKLNTYGKLTLLNKAQGANIFWISNKTLSKPMNCSLMQPLFYHLSAQNDFQHDFNSFSLVYNWNCMDTHVPLVAHSINFFGDVRLTTQVQKCPVDL